MTYTSSRRIVPCSWMFGIGILCIILTAIAFCEVFYHFDNHYQAAVVEYHPDHYPAGTPAETILMENVKRYAKFVTESKENLDIIVFPESTLTTMAVMKKRLDMLNYSTTVPDPSDGIDVCDSHHKFPPFFTYLACIAKKAKIYLVVNLIEQKLCFNKSYYGEYRQCSKDSWNFYNTDVVFDRKGRVIGRYRKYHLFGEVWMNRTVNPDIAIFKTDFGVKFGMFTCFDIMFRNPSLDLVKAKGITHVIYPTMWLSELPFLTALQTQMQWAYASDAVLLASGANNCLKGSGGTGIFQGKSGAVVYDYSEEGVSKLYVSRLPQLMNEYDLVYNENDIDDEARKMDKFYLMKESLTKYTMQLIDPLAKDVSTILCDTDGNRQLCCHFDIKLVIAGRNENNKEHYNYFMVAYKGVRSFKNVAKGGLEICGVIACTNSTRESCGQRFPDYNNVTWPVTFNEISIKANFSLKDNKMQYPNSLLSNIKPLPVNTFKWEFTTYENNAVIERSLKLVKPQNRLFTFAIYGRDFSKDINIFH